MNIKDINKLAFPAIIAGISEPLITLGDTAIIGHLGTNELAAVGVGSSLFLLQVWALSQTKSAISAIVSRYYGKKEVDKIGNFVFQASFFNLIIGMLIIFLSVIGIDEIFRFYNIEGEIFRLAKEYYYIRAAGLPLTLVTLGIFGVFRGFQNTSWAMQISIIGGLLNLVFDIVLVYGVENVVSPMGIQGAAWASLAAQLIMFLLAVFYLKKKPLMAFVINFSPNPEIKNFIGMFGNLFLRTVALNIAYFLGTKFAASYGNVSIAAHTIAMNIWLFSSFFTDGYASAGNAIAGKLLGEEDYPGIGRIGRMIYKLTIGAASFLGLLYALSYFFIGKLFTSDENVLMAFQSVFWIVILSQPVNGLAFGLDGIFKGLGKTRYLRNTLIGATLLGFIPTLLVCDYLGMKLYGVWAAFFVFMLYRAIRLLWKFKLEFGSW